MVFTGLFCVGAYVCHRTHFSSPLVRSDKDLALLKRAQYIEDGECNQRLLDRMVRTDSIVKVVYEGKGHSLIMFVANHSDIPMAQFIINFNNSMPNAHKFIIHILDDTHLFVQENVVEMIRKKVQDFRDQNTFEKPT